VNSISSGQTTLTGANTYTGDTTITAGTLQVGNGGTTGTLGSGAVINNSALALNRSDNTTIANDISGTGSVTHSGAGATTFTGANTYTGATNINAGSLFVNGSLGQTSVIVASGASLGGSGSIGGNVKVQSGGFLAPGNSPGILTLGSLTLESGSTTFMELNGTTPGTEYDQIVVNGAAALDGTLSLSYGYSPVNGDTFTLIDAQSITGDFDQVINPLGNALIFDVILTDDYVFEVIAVQTEFGNLIGNDPDLLKIAAVIDDNSSDPAILPIINALNKLPGEALPEAFEQINPEELTALASVSFANARNAIYRLGNRMSEVRKGVTGFSTTGLNLYDQNGSIRNSLVADRSTGIPAGLITQPLGTASESPLSYFLSGHATLVDQDGDNSGSGFEDDNFGALFGADYRVASDLSLGVYGGFDHSDTDFEGNGGGADTDTYRIGLSGTWWTTLNDASDDAQHQLYTEAHLGGAYHDYETKRNAFGGASKGDTNATEFDLGAAVGYEIAYATWRFTTDLSLNYIHLSADGFTEKGGLAPLTIEDDTSESLYSALSFRADMTTLLADVDLRPYVLLGWRHEYLDAKESVTARFPGSSAASFTVDGATSDRDALISGVGVSALLSKGFTAQLGYYGELSSDFELHTINASLNLAF
jgi:autotransporter-associated beta strand protein